MNISMHILASHLQPYNPVLNIQNGDMVLCRCRLLTDYHDSDAASTVYICASADYIPTMKNGIICSNGQDYIFLKTDDILEVFNKVLDLFEFYNMITEQLYQLILQKSSMVDLLSLCGQMLPLPLVLCNSGHMIQAFTNCETFEKDGNPVFTYAMKHHFIPTLLYESVNEDFILHYNDHSSFYIDKRNEQLFHTINHNIFYQKWNVGYLTAIFCSSSDNTIAHRQLFDYISGCLESGYEALHASSSNPLGSNQIFIQLLEGTPVDPTSLLLQAQAFGWTPNDQKLLLILSQEHMGKNSLPVITSRFIVHYPNSFIFSYREQAVAILNISKYPPAFFSELQTFLRELHCHAGISYSFTDLTQVKSGYEQASLALRYSSHTSGNLYFCENYMLNYVKETLRNHLSIDIWRRELQLLKNYDEKHQTEYYHTLYMYLLEERNQTLTAQKLHIHRNTLVKRIGRIQELIPVDLSDTQTRLQLLFSFFVQTP